MVTLAISSRAGPYRASFLTNFPKYYSRISSSARSSYSTGFVPPQTALVGSADWNAMLKNIETYHQRPPLFKSEIRESQRIYTIEKRMDQMTEILKDIVESNARLHGDMNHVIQLLKQE